MPRESLRPLRSLGGSLCVGIALALVAVVGGLVGGCDSGNPVVQSPTDPGAEGGGSEGGGGGGGGGGDGTSSAYTVTLAVSPSQLEVSSDSPATVTANVRDSATAEAAPDGVQVTLNTSGGSFGESGSGDITSLTRSTVGGTVSAQLFAPDTIGSITVLAQADQSVAQVEVPVVAVAQAYILDVSPRSGSAAGGDTVQIFGDGFIDPLRVRFGSVLAGVTAFNETRITVTAPASPTPVADGGTLPVDIVVDVRLDDQPQTATLVGGYVYVGGDVAATTFLTAIDPSSGGATGGERVTVAGGGFEAPLQVLFGAVVGTNPEIVSENELTVTVPAPAAPLGIGESVTVVATVNAALGDVPRTATLPGAWTYVDSSSEPEQPAVFALSPTSGPIEGGTTVTVTGRAFEGTPAITLAGIRQTGETLVGATEITFTTVGSSVSTCPSGGLLPQTGVVYTDLASGATASADLTFTYLVDVPLIDRITPTTGSQAGGQTLAVRGSGFDAPVRVSLSASGQTFAAAVSSAVSDLVQVTTPTFPDSVLPTEECTGTVQVGDPPVPTSFTGIRSLEIAADIVVTNLATGCTDTLGSAFIVQPTDPSCRQTSG